MPRLWIYLIKKFLHTFVFTLAGIILFLIVIRFSSIAGFATSGSGLLLILKFIGLLVPYILPYAIPISTLNAALVVSRRLSLEKQLTALRASGISLKSVFSPVLIVFIFISGSAFFVSGTLAPLCKTKSKTLIYDTTLKHPLFITQKACPIKIQSIYTDVGKMESGETAENLLLVFKNKKSNRISLMIADKLSVKDGVLKGKNLAVVSSINNKQELQDDLFIENQSYMKTGTQIVDVLLYKDEAVDGADYMDFFQLVQNISKKPHFKTEFYKRLNMGLAPFTLGFLGLCFGLHISRKKSNISLFIAILLATIFMASLVTARSLKSRPEICLAIYSSIHALIISCSLLKLRQVQRGKG